MNATIKTTPKGRTLVIEVPVNEPLTPSKSLKNLSVFSSHGNRATTCQLDGKFVTIGLNAYVSP